MYIFKHGIIVTRAQLLGNSLEDDGVTIADHVHSLAANQLQFSVPVPRGDAMLVRANQLHARVQIERAAIKP